MLYNKEEIEKLEFGYKINLINSITGIKPANLIGTCDENKQENLAIFSSVFHLGSNPPLIGFITRPSQKGPRHTLENILQQKYYSINHIPTSKVENAHYTSAKFEKGISEFSTCGFTTEYYTTLPCPFVKESSIQIGLQLEELIPVKANNTTIVVGKICFINIKNDDFVDFEGNLDLTNAKTAAVSGLHSYYSLNQIGSFPKATLESPFLKTKVE